MSIYLHDNNNNNNNNNNKNNRSVTCRDKFSRWQVCDCSVNGNKNSSTFMSVSDEGKLLFKEKLANENSIDNTDDLAKETEIPHVGYEQLLNVGNLYIWLKIYDKKKTF